ncbi:8327_t:CDS:2, partial [Cetraspora pellucida]
IVGRSEKLQTILVSQLESHGSQLPLNIVDCGSVAEEKALLGLAVQKLDAVTKNLATLIELSNEGDLNSEVHPLDLAPLQELLTDYGQEIYDQKRVINILKNESGEKDKAIQKLVETQQGKDDEISNLRTKIGEERKLSRRQKKELDNLTGSYQALVGQVQSLKSELAIKERKLNQAAEEIRKLQDDLSDAQNASSSRAKMESFAEKAEEYSQKVVQLQEEKNHFWECFLVIQDKLENFRKVKLEALAFLVTKPKKRRSSAPVPKSANLFSQPMRKSASTTATPLPTIKEEYFATNRQPKAKNITISKKETSLPNKLTWEFPYLSIVFPF